MGYKICKFCRSEMMSQGNNIYTREIILECFVCPKCGAIYDSFMNRKYEELKTRCQWFNPDTEEFEPSDKK